MKLVSFGDPFTYEVCGVSVEWILGYRTVNRRICQYECKVSVGEWFHNKPEICITLNSFESKWVRFPSEVDPRYTNTAAHSLGNTVLYPPKVVGVQKYFFRKFWNSEYL
jgi:hypothetical protein